MRHELCMCAIQRVIGQDKSAFEGGYGSKCQAHRFVSRTTTLLGFSCATASCVSISGVPSFREVGHSAAIDLH